MSRLTDPSICPDCRVALLGTRCPACGLVLSGELADRLWQQLVAADATITDLRAAQPAAFAPAPAPAAPAPPAAAPARTGLDGKTVPVLLLSLGGLLVFVAVSLFLAVTWAELPLAVKAVLMVGFTAAVGLGARALTRKALPGAAETVWALTAALLALDLSAAWRSDLAGLHGVPAREMTAASGALLAALGVAVALWARRTPLARLVSAQVVAGGAIAVVTFSELVGGSGLRPTVGFVLLAGLAALLHRHLMALGYAVAALAVVVWLDLVAGGLDRLDLAGSRSSAWSSLEGWPLLVGAVLAAGVAAIGLLPQVVRTGAAVASLAALAGLVLVPAAFDTTTALIGASALAATAGLATVPSRIWSLAAGLLAAVGATVVALGAAMTPVALAARATDFLPWSHTALGARLPEPGAPAAWTLLALVAAAVAAAYVLAGLAPPARRTDARHLVLGTMPAVTAYALAAVVVGSGQPLWAGTAALVVAAVVGVALAPLAHRFLAGGALGLLAGATALVLATRSDLLSAAVSTVATLVVLAVVLRTVRATDAWWPAVLPLAPLATWAGFGWCSVAPLDRTPTVIVVALVPAALLVSAALWLSSPVRRIAVEASSLAALALVCLTTLDDARLLALALTVAGSALALLSVTYPDRHTAAWPASGILAAATLARFSADVRVPELYALPAAALLLVVGWRRLGRDSSFGSWAALGSGLNLALVPSLLVALPEPSSVRGLLVGLGAALALGVGITRRWQAPYLTGSAVLAALALRFLLPLAHDVLANPLGAWMLFGSAGGALLAAGIMWEQSLRQLRSASRYVEALV